MYLIRKSREISFTHNFLFSCQIILKFCTERDSTVLCANFQNDLTTELMFWKNNISRDLSLRCIDVFEADIFYCDIPGDPGLYGTYGRYYRTFLDINDRMISSDPDNFPYD